MTIEELKQALEAATPGPWEIFETGTWPETNHFYGIGATKPGNGCYAVAAIEGWTKGEHPNARLIVAAVNNLPRLLKVAEASEPLARLAETHHARSPSEDYVPASLLWDLFTALHGETPAEARQRKALEELNND